MSVALMRVPIDVFGVLIYGRERLFRRLHHALRCSRNLRSCKIGAVAETRNMESREQRQKKPEACRDCRRLGPAPDAR
jgi:hypothetical protein